MALGDLYRVEVTSLQANQELLNVFTYEQTVQDGIVLPASTLSVSFQAGIFPLWRAVCSVSWALARINVYNLFDVTDFVESVISPNLAGTVAGDVSPPFLTIGLRSPRTSLLVRQGKKRFSGIPETSITNGAVSAGVITAWNNFATGLNDTIPLVPPGTGHVFSPRIVKRIPYTTPSGATAYRFPENAGEAISVLANNWELERVTTQNSRKIGQGQ